MTGSTRINWAASTLDADWIASRVGDLGDGVTSVVPSGYEAYARILHPAWSEGRTRDDDVPVRWREVAEWSGLDMTRLAQFHSIALSPNQDPGPAPYSRGPDEGSLSEPDLHPLVGSLSRWTSTPDDCFFCVWEGWGYLGVPPEVERGPRVRLPHRDYLLYRGTVGTVQVNVAESPWRQAPNLWWPQDRTWFVGSEIDLICSYVAGPEGLIDELLSAPVPEALLALPNDPLDRVEPWLQARVDAALDQLFETNSTRITLPIGWVRADIKKVRGNRWTDLSFASERTNRGRQATSESVLGGTRSYEEARRAAEHGLTGLLIELAR